MSAQRVPQSRWTVEFLSIWITIIFLLGGGARSDIQSLLALQPAACLVLASGLSALSLDQIREHRFILALAASFVALHLLHLVPLPPSVWAALPGRELITQIDRAAGLEGGWRPISMAPEATRSSLWTLLVPLSVLIWAVQLSPREQVKALLVIVGLGLLSALLSIAQLLGGGASPLYFYRITNEGFQVGLFANRNHQAALLALLPAMLTAALALMPARRQAPVVRDRTIKAVAFGTSGVLLTLVLVSGSRSGIVVALVVIFAVAIMLLTLRPPRAGERSARNFHRLLFPALASAILGAGVLLFLSGQADSIERLLRTEAATEMRFVMLPAIASMTAHYAPLGTGLGSFEKVFQLHESHEVLRSFYANHAHNDWIELALTGGVPALVILVAALAFLVRNTAKLYQRRQCSQELILGRLGVLILAVFALCSLTDYPLRVPSLASVAAVALVWSSSGPARRRHSRPPSNMPIRKVSRVSGADARVKAS